MSDAARGAPEGGDSGPTPEDGQDLTTNQRAVLAAARDLCTNGTGEPLDDPRVGWRSLVQKVPISRSQTRDAVDRMVTEDWMFQQSGRVAPAEKAILRQIITAEVESGMPRTHIIGQCNKLIRAAEQRDGERDD